MDDESACGCCSLNDAGGDKGRDGKAGELCGASRGMEGRSSKVFGAS